MLDDSFGDILGDVTLDLDRNPKGRTLNEFYEYTTLRFDFSETER